MHQNKPQTLTTSQISESTLVPLSKVYTLKKKLIAGLHYREIRSTSNNTKQIEWFGAGVTAIENLHWLPAGIKAAWSPERIEAFKQTSLSLDLEVAT